MKQEISQLVDQVLELKNDQEEMVRSHQHQLDRVVSEVVPRTLEHLLDEYKKVTKLRRAKEEDDMELVVYVQVEHALESFIPFQGADDLLLQATVKRSFFVFFAIFSAKNGWLFKNLFLIV